MITSLGLRNFKAFGAEPVTIPLAPITLIYGPNSAGKSSIIQALQLVKQSYRPHLDCRFTPGQLGDYETLVYGHDLSRTIGIQVCVDAPSDAQELSSLLPIGRSNCAFAWTYGFSKEDGTGRLHKHAITIAGKNRVSVDCRSGLATIHWTHRPQEERLLRDLQQIGKFHGSIDELIIKLNETYSDLALQCDETGINWLLEPGRAEAVNKSPVIGPYVQDELHALWEMLGKALSACLQIGPQRRDPHKAASMDEFLSSLTGDAYVGEEGEHVEDLLRGNSQLLADVNSRLRDLNVGYTLGVIQGGAASRQLVLTDSHAMNVSLRHVGYGVSQLLPIVVQAVAAKNATILIQQPELHIHPRLQGACGELFVATSRGTNSNQYVIETHSEMLALRLQRCIREKRLTADSVSVVYVDSGDAGAKLIPLRLDTFGHFIDEWPDGFFEEGFDELFGAMT